MMYYAPLSSHQGHIVRYFVDGHELDVQDPNFFIDEEDKESAEDKESEEKKNLAFDEWHDLMWPC